MVRPADRSSAFRQPYSWNLFRATIAGRAFDDSQMSFPEATLSTLPHADGSATYSWQGYTIHCAVNGPIEPQRRDELPEEAFLEVNVRPASRSGGDLRPAQPTP